MDTAASYIAIPEGVTSIDERTIYECTNLERVYIPQSVTSIAEHAFDMSSKPIMYYGIAESYAEEWAAMNGYPFEPVG